MRIRALVIAAALALLPARSQGEVPNAGDLPGYDPSSPTAPVVSEANLLASERFWPYQVGLVKPWQPPGRPQPLPVGATGVLIRVEDGGRLARVDFGRDGLYELPVAATDLVERANRVRRGELDKMAPNYVLAIGPRLVDTAADPPRTFPFADVNEYRVFLGVFADPRAADFETLAKALAPFQERAGLLTILFPQGERPDPETWERLRAIGWPVPFVQDHLSDPYTRTLLAEGADGPALQLVSAEGRVLFAGAAKPEVAPALREALDRALPAASAGP